MAYFPPRQTASRPAKAEAAFDATKRDIMLGVLELGTGLTELDLAAHFQCSQRHRSRKRCCSYRRRDSCCERGGEARGSRNAPKTKQSKCSAFASRSKKLA